ncbi:HlyD family type I secretion periplasmic adaptor subunit [Magnetococcus sp. PR-3]|uniref:HlyD family type I secretion periplasmic adaptor subunit n=1 Tax=Magnetococcus sp. PR-3 TaxID=3120355 RepID=UPI002FCE19EC
MFKRSSEHQTASATLHLKQLIRLPLLGAVLVVVLFFGLLGGWSAQAPIASAAIAPGAISPEGYRRTVQHLEGGIIQHILVEEGEMVFANAPLVVLEDTQAMATYRIQKNRYQALKAMEARLLAESRSQQTMAWNTYDYTEADATLQKDQENLFQARLASHQTQRRILAKRIAQLNQEIVGLEGQIKSKNRQMSLIRQEIRGVRQLVEKGLGKRPRLLALQRSRAQIEGDLAAQQAAVARAQQSIGETEMKILNLETSRWDQAAKELGEVRQQLADLASRLTNSSDILQRTVITAPVAGRVFNLRFTTNGGVIKPGDAVLEIVPQQEILLVDARINPSDVDVVKPGLQAEITLNAYPQRNLPRLKGVVRSISADLIIEPNSGQSYYRARIALSSESLQALDEEIELLPGMAADTLIFTGSRTLLAYLTEPLMQSLYKSFRES